MSKKILSKHIKEKIIDECVEELKSYHVDLSKYKKPKLFLHDVTAEVEFVGEHVTFCFANIYFDDNTGNILQCVPVLHRS